MKWNEISYCSKLPKHSRKKNFFYLLFSAFIRTFAFLFIYLFEYFCLLCRLKELHCFGSYSISKKLVKLKVIIYFQRRFRSKIQQLFPLNHQSKCVIASICLLIRDFDDRKQTPVLCSLNQTYRKSQAFMEFNVNIGQECGYIWNKIW